MLMKAALSAFEGYIKVRSRRCRNQRTACSAPPLWRTGRTDAQIWTLTWCEKQSAPSCWRRLPTTRANQLPGFTLYALWAKPFFQGVHRSGGHQILMPGSALPSSRTFREFGQNNPNEIFIAHGRAARHNRSSPSKAQVNSAPMIGKGEASAAKIIDRCRKLARFSEEPGCTTRTFLSAPMRDCHREITGSALSGQRSRI